MAPQANFWCVCGLALLAVAQARVAEFTQMVNLSPPSLLSSERPMCSWAHFKGLRFSPNIINKFCKLPSYLLDKRRKTRSIDTARDNSWRLTAISNFAFLRSTLGNCARHPENFQYSPDLQLCSDRLHDGRSRQRFSTETIHDLYRHWGSRLF